MINEASLEGRCLVLKRRIENGRGGVMKYSNDAVCEVQNSQTGIYSRIVLNLSCLQPSLILNNYVLGTIYLQISYFSGPSTVELK